MMDFFKWMDSENEKQKSRVDKAMSDRRLQALIAELGLTREDIQEADNRIQLLGISDRAKRKALHDPELLRDLFRRLGSDREWQLEDYLDWSLSALDKYG